MADRYEYLLPERNTATRGGTSQRLQKIYRPPGALAEAVLRWGAKSNFNLTGNEAPTDPSFNVLLPIDYPSDDDLTDPTQALVFTEINRQVSVVRVFNPQDNQQWVDVERIEQISFMGPDNRIRTFVLTNNPA